MRTRAVLLFRENYGVSRIVEMRLDGTLTGHEIPLEREDKIRGICLAGGDETGNEIIALSNYPAGEFVRIKGLGPLPPVTDRPFVRGDANESSVVDISDAIFLLGYLFLGTASPSCLGAADINDDGGVDIADAIYVLNFLFLGRLAPPEPFPLPRLDPTPDTLPCEVQE